MNEPYRTAPFWTPAVLDLIERKDREADLVVADWLEERGYAHAAEVFRSTERGEWRLLLATVARSVPHAAPDEEMLRLIEAQVREIMAQRENRASSGTAIRSLMAVQEEVFVSVLDRLRPETADGSQLNRLASLFDVSRGQR